jgi:hypothetical protein
MSEKAISIGHYFVASGVYTVVGFYKKREKGIGAGMDWKGRGMVGILVGYGGGGVAGGRGLKNRKIGRE